MAVSVSVEQTDRRCLNPTCSQIVTGRSDKLYHSANCRERARDPRYQARYAAEHREEKREAAARWYEHERNKKKKRVYGAERYAIIGGWIHGLREEADCADCGDSESPLEFDHLPERGEKLFDVGTFGRRAIKTVKAEIAKCELACYRCHKWRTMARIVGLPLRKHRRPLMVA